MKRLICLLLAAAGIALGAAPAFAAGSAPLPAVTKNNGSPYYIMVNRKANCVTVYGLDETGCYGIPVRAMVCSTGKPGCDTPPGTFAITNRAAWMYMADGSYGQYATRFNGAILFHSICYKKKDPSTLMTYEYNALGGFASLGCVRLQTIDAKWVYDNCPQGTKVTVYDAETPGPLGKPGTLVPQISEAQDNGWDPTDPRAENPWRSVIGSKAGTSSAILGMPFLDVKVADWYYPHVLGAYRADLMRGTGEKTFAPQSPLTYAQALQLIYNLRTDKTVPSVPAGSAWYAPALRWAEMRGITLAADGRFDPDAVIPRRMFALYLQRMAQKEPQIPADETLAAFADADTVTRPFRSALAWAVENGIMTGYQGNILPDSELSRAQASVMLLRFKEL